ACADLYALSLHDALPILQAEDLSGYRPLPSRFPDSVRMSSPALLLLQALFSFMDGQYGAVLEHLAAADRLLQSTDPSPDTEALRSEEHTSELQSRENLVC